MANEAVKARRAGRKKSPVKRFARTFRLSDEEYFALAPLIDAIRDRTDAKYKVKPLPLDT